MSPEEFRQMSLLNSSYEKMNKSKVFNGFMTKQEFERLVFKKDKEYSFPERMQNCLEQIIKF